MNRKEQLQKIGEDLVLMEEKLQNILLCDNSEVYRGLIHVYYDNITSYAKILNYMSDYEEQYYNEQFYLDRQNFISTHIELISKTSKIKLERNEFKDYKRFNQSFQTLIEISNKIDNIFKIIRKRNLINYKNPNSIISKDLLLDRVTHKTCTIIGHSGDNILSIDIVRDDTDNTYITTFMIMNNIPKDTITHIKTNKYNNVKDVVEQIKQYKNIDRIIIDSIGIKQAVIDELESDGHLSKKITTVRHSNGSLQDSITKLKQDLEDNKLVFYSRCFISEEILHLFKEIQDTEFKLSNHKISIVNKGNNTTRLHSLLNFYSKLNPNRKELVD